MIPQGLQGLIEELRIILGSQLPLEGSLLLLLGVGSMPGREVPRERKKAPDIVCEREIICVGYLEWAKAKYLCSRDLLDIWFFEYKCKAFITFFTIETL